MSDWAEVCSRVIGGFEFRLTCRGFPEQYDVYAEGVMPIGYVRARNNRLTVQCAYVGGELVHYADWRDVDGSVSGNIPDEHRELLLTRAADQIANWWHRGDADMWIHSFATFDDGLHVESWSWSGLG